MSMVLDKVFLYWWHECKQGLCVHRNSTWNNFTKHCIYGHGRGVCTSTDLLCQGLNYYEILSKKMGCVLHMHDTIRFGFYHARQDKRKSKVTQTVNCLFLEWNTTTAGKHGEADDGDDRTEGDDYCYLREPEHQLLPQRLLSNQSWLMKTSRGPFHDNGYWSSYSDESLRADHFVYVWCEPLVCRTFLSGTMHIVLLFMPHRWCDQSTMIIIILYNLNVAFAQNLPVRLIYRNIGINEYRFQEKVNIHVWTRFDISRGHKTPPPVYVMLRVSLHVNL